VGTVRFYYVRQLNVLRNGTLKKGRIGVNSQFLVFWVDFVVPRNAKALKCVVAAIEEIT